MVYFTRHGESEANIEKVFSNTGFKHPLTINGIDQAKQLANKIQDRNITRIVSSPVLRAIQTASIIAEHVGLKSFEVFEYLREYDVGDLEGKADSTSWNLYYRNEKIWKDIEKRHYSLPNGENYLEIQNRFRTCITKILSDKTYINNDILIITHGGLLKIGMPAMCKNIDYEFTCNNPINNCDIICCDIAGNLLKCRNWGINFLSQKDSDFRY